MLKNRRRSGDEQTQKNKARQNMKNKNQAKSKKLE